MKEEIRKELTEHLIPFWAGLKDEINGGFYGKMDFHLNVDQTAEKGVILNSRILWFFSKSFTLLQDKTCLDCAKHAYDFMMNYALDCQNSGVFWSLNHDGTVKDSTKHSYNQAFAIYALSAFYEATGEKKALETALELYHLIEEKCRDKEGYLESFTADFQPQSNEKLSENGIIASRTMNTLLHIFEGYAGLYAVSKNPEVKKSMEEILEIYIHKIYNKSKKRQEVFFDLNYHSLLDLHSYGHDIESAWLIEWGANLLDNPKISKKIREISSEMVENLYTLAYHDNSLFNECENGINDKTRVWWVQAEAMVGFLNEWQQDQTKKQYYEATTEIWGFIQKHLKDARENSEWFWEVDENFLPSSEKDLVEPWKCPYHNGRMCLELLARWNELK